MSLSSRDLLRLVVGVFPASAIKNRLMSRLGYEVASSASIGPVLLLSVDHLKMSEGSRIGPFNVLRDLAEVNIGGHASIGQWNWISAAYPLRLRGAPATLRLCDESALTSRHYADATGGIEIGHHTTVAGVRSTFITHGIDWRQAAQVWKPIQIGSYCIIGSNTNLPPGTFIPDGSVVGMGATLPRGLEQSNTLYVSDRAKPIRDLKGAYFTREQGPVQ